MITGIGIDIVDIERMEDKISGDKGFREFVFSKDEIAYCNHQANPAQHYAARFAAKEAFLKASGEGLTISYKLSDIVVVSGDNGRPQLRLEGDFKILADKNSWTQFHISLSHSKTIATAFVIIEK